MKHQEEIHVRVPQVRDPLAAIRLYYSKTELSTGDIRDLFVDNRGNRIGGDRALRLKKLAKIEADNRGIPNYDVMKCNTEVAYEVWGIKISDLERRYAKLQKYKEEAVS